MIEYATDRPFADPNKAARRLMEHARELDASGPQTIFSVAIDNSSAAAMAAGTTDW